MNAKEEILNGKTYLGIEFGSTRIKGVLIDANHNPIAQGSFTWENSFIDGIWTYSKEEIFNGLKACYMDLKNDVKYKYGITLTKLGGIGISAMMHGYLPFDKDNNLLVPFRTWRNAITGQAAKELSELFNFNIPERWSIAHFYQAILNKEKHVKDVSYFTSLDGYVHRCLTGKNVVGIGTGSGLFPVDAKTLNYDQGMMDKFNKLLVENGINKKIEEFLPQILLAGDNAGYLTKEGALLLDADGDLEGGAPICPPEGDAETGMVATNAISVRTGNVSAGTSVFSMAVLENKLSKRYTEIDVVSTPDGKDVAMVHANNCTNEINALANIIKDTTDALGLNANMNDIYTMIFTEALEGDKDCGGLTVYNYLSGETITNMPGGRPLYVRSENANFTISNLCRAELYSAIATLFIGNRILQNEGVKLDKLSGHGGYFKTGRSGARFMAAALNTNIHCLETAGEGGPWGMAVLAAYMANKDNYSLKDYLNEKVFKDAKSVIVSPDNDDREGFLKFMEKYEKGLEIERKAVEVNI